MDKVTEDVIRTRPNLYKYATNERAQDAFISWFIHWAAPEFKNTDPILHRCSVDFIDALFDKAKIVKPKEYSPIEIFNQKGHIDVLVILNDFSYAIIIEDKTDTKNSQSQLAEYLEFVTMDRSCSQIPRENIVPIYLKTGDQSSYKSIKNNNFFEFLRIDLLGILRRGKSNGIDNHIFIDFLEHLETIEGKVNRYKDEPISVWTSNKNRAWVGFFSEIKELIGTGDWAYVHNPSSGFMGFWWHSIKVGNVKLHLQLEETRLCFKVGMESKGSANKSSTRNAWHRRITAEAKKQNPVEFNIVRPERFGSGQYMTIAVLHNYIKINQNDVINIQNTINVLKKCETILDAAVRNHLNDGLLPE